MGHAAITANSNAAMSLEPRSHGAPPPSICSKACWNFLSSGRPVCLSQATPLFSQIRSGTSPSVKGLHLVHFLKITPDLCEIAITAGQSSHEAIVDSIQQRLVHLWWPCRRRAQRL